MAQTNYTPISLYYSATAASVPTAGNLVAGELALNTADGKLFYKDSSGVVQTLASKSTGTIGGSTTQVQYNNNGVLAGSVAFTFDTNSNLLVGATAYTGIDTGSQRLTVQGIAGGNGGTLGLISDSLGRNIVLTDSGKTQVAVYSLSSTVASIGTNTSIPLVFNTVATERMRIDSSGNLLVGATSTINAERLAVWTVSGSGIKQAMVINNAYGYGSGVGTASSALTFTRSRSTSEFYPMSQIVGGNESESTSALGFRYTGVGTYYWGCDSSGNAILNKDGTERMRIDNAGNVGIGTSSPSQRLTVFTSGSNFTTLRAQNGTSSFDFAQDPNGEGLVGQNGAYAIRFATNATERMRITSAGKLLVNTTNVLSDGQIVIESPMAVTTGSVYQSTSTSGTANFSYFIYNGSGVGTITSTGTTCLYNSISDQRLKENIVDAGSGLDKLSNVKIRSFNWKINQEKTDFGVVAQELYEVAPEAVTVGTEKEDGSVDKSWSVDTSVLIPAMIKAIQEQQALIESLTTRLTALENK